MTWSEGSVWRRVRVVYCGLGPTGWGVSSTMRLSSPGSLLGMPSRLSSSLRRGDLEESIAHPFFHCPVERPLCKVLGGYLVQSWMKCFFVLEAAMWCHHWTGWNIACLAFWVSWFERRDRGNSTKVILFLRTCIPFWSIKAKLRSGLRKRLVVDVWQKVGNSSMLVLSGNSQPFSTLDMPGF